tara:strand:+ start:186 stop:1040 length:855 start_codon:yes stop_codon:yes gene_type:complete
MNSILAQIYGTGGIDKVAADATEDSTIDLNAITGAQLLEGLEDGSIVFQGDEDEGTEKVAGDEDGEIDLSQYTGQEILDMLEKFEGDGEGEEVLNKMAQDGSAEYWDMAGRIMAHAYADEMNKVAAGDDEFPEYIDPSEIDGKLMVDLIESGQYELVKEELEKEAGAAGAKDWLKATGRKAGDAARSAAEKTKDVAGRAAESGKKGVESVSETVGKGLESGKQKSRDAAAAAKDKGGKGWAAYKAALKGESGRGRQAAAVGGTAGGVGLAGALAALGVKKRNQD